MKKLLSLKQTEAIIKRNNRRFKAASAAQKRVIIALDTISRVIAKQYTPETGNWINVDKWDEELQQYRSDRSPAQTAIVSGVDCSGCALGGLMMSCTVLNNKMSLGSISHFDIGGRVKAGRKIKNGLNQFFTNAQLRMIETAYELGDGYDSWGNEWLYSPLRQTCVVFGRRFRSDSKRLLAIMRNIVRNKGEFKP